MLTAGAAPALADPSGSGRPVYPSKQQVDDAKHAVTSKAGQVDAIQAQLAVASARLEQAQTAAEVAAEAYNAAKVELDQRTKAAQQARARATAAQQRADDAREAVGRLAVDTYVSGPQARRHRGAGRRLVAAGPRRPRRRRPARGFDHQPGARHRRRGEGRRRGSCAARPTSRWRSSRRLLPGSSEPRQAAADRAGAAASEAASISAQRTSLIAQARIAAADVGAGWLSSARPAWRRRPAVAPRPPARPPPSARPPPAGPPPRRPPASRPAATPPARPVSTRPAPSAPPGRTAARRTPAGSSHSSSGSSHSSGSPSSGGGSSGGGSSAGSSSGGRAAVSWARTQARQVVRVGRRRPLDVRLLGPDHARLAAVGRVPAAQLGDAVPGDPARLDGRPARRRPAVLRDEHVQPVDDPPRGAVRRRRHDARGAAHRRPGADQARCTALASCRTPAAPDAHPRPLPRCE
nr:hypothetical protein [Angustibacter aerolatus]